MWILRFLCFVAAWAGRFKGVAFITAGLGFGVMFWPNLWQSVLTVNPVVLGMGVMAIGLIIYLVVETAINWYPKHIAATRYISLPKQRRMYLLEIADKIAEADHINSEEVFHALMRALWRGEFEDKKGNSRTKLPMPRGKQYPHNEQPIPTNGQGTPLNLDDVPLEEFSRARLLCVWEPVNGINVPNNLQIEATEWKQLSNTIDFKKLEGLLPRRYPNHYLSAYLENLTINQTDFKKWLMRYVGGFYEGVYE